MLKQVHKFLLLSSLIVFLSFNSAVFAQNDNIFKQNIVNEQTLALNNAKTSDFETSPIDTQNLKKNVVPDSKKESKKVINLFLRVMMAVLLSAGILYVILLFIKKYYGSAFAVQEYDEYESLNLSTPNDKEEALKSFLNRTK